MSRTAIIFGSTTGNTESIAQTIAQEIGADLLNAADSPDKKIAEYDNLILGTSTWGIGDLQDDWDSFLPLLVKADLNGKKIALFALGDSDGYGDSFVDGMGVIYEALSGKGCTVVGAVETEGYSFSESKAVVNGTFVGLPLDEDNESHLTKDRLAKWLAEIQLSFNK